MMVGVGGTVADIERRTVTLRLFMRPYPADNDCEAIAVELVNVGCDGNGDQQVNARVHQIGAVMVPTLFEACENSAEALPASK